jgi:hypothetical protein
MIRLLNNNEGLFILLPNYLQLSTQSINGQSRSFDQKWELI